MTEMLEVSEDLGIIDLDAILMKNKRLYFLFFIASTVGGALLQSTVTGSSIFTKINIFRGLLVLFGLWAAFSNSPKVQKLVALIFLLIYTTVVVLYRLNLGELSQ